MKKAEQTALYSIIKAKIIELIKAGTYKPDEKLPTEAEFCAMFDVSRTTIRIALQQLELEGRIYRQQGKGTFVAKSKIKQSLTTASKGFAEQMVEQGLEPVTKVISLEVIPATSSYIDLLNLQKNDPIIKLVRLRYASHEPIQYVESYIPWKVAPGLTKQEGQGSLFQILEQKYHIQVGKTVEAVEPILADDQISLHLEIPVGAPCLTVETTTFSTAQSPIEYSHAVFRGDRSKFIVERVYTDLE